MTTPLQSLFKSFQQRVTTIETTITRGENVLSFLVIRFVLMTGMVLGFTWTFLHYAP